jgi:cytochrome c oxidase subunit IV
MEQVEGHQQHPLGVYFKVWALLFVLSSMSYAVDYFHVEGLLRWSLILIFMFLKAGLIIAVFMHMVWERLALVYAIIVPPLAILVLVAIMLFEADYTMDSRMTTFGASPVPVGHHGQSEEQAEKEPSGDH